MAERFTLFTLHLGNIVAPLLSKLFEHGRRNGQLTVSSVNDGRVAIFSQRRNISAVIEHRLTEQRPCFELGRVVLEGLKARCSSDNLAAVVAAKRHVWGLTLLRLRNAEADHGTVH